MPLRRHDLYDANFGEIIKRVERKSETAESSFVCRTGTGGGRFPLLFQSRAYNGTAKKSMICT